MRPAGQVDLLLGSDYAGYFPRLEKAWGHLLLLRSYFGSGRLVVGRLDPDVRTDHGLLPAPRPPDGMKVMGELPGSTIDVSKCDGSGKGKEGLMQAG